MKFSGQSLMGIVVKSGASLGVSFLVLGLLFGLVEHMGGTVSAEVLMQALRRALPGFIAIYVVCQIGQTLLRAWRTRLLLAAALPERAPPPGFGWLALVTFVRGACVDMLPARLGELSYVVMLNKGCDIRAADGLATLSLGIYFDFAALLLVLVLALGMATGSAPLWVAAALLCLFCLAGYAGLFHVLPWAGRLIARRGWAAGTGISSKAMRFAADAIEAVGCVRQRGKLLAVLAISAGIRAAKYIGLYLLFLAVVRPMWPALAAAPASRVLVALIAAEGAASLPIPAFMSFGTYEAGGLAALTLLGFAAGESMLAMLGMHLLSQVVDYTLGGLSFLLFLWIPKKREGVEGEKPSRVRRGHVLTVGLLVWVVAGYAAWEWRAFQKRGRLTAPPPGTEGVFSAAEIAQQQRVTGETPLRIVWSSNRAGSHDIWMLELPERKLTRLTQSGFTDTYPRFSPDGRHILFMRSRQPWVSQRNGMEWDTWRLDLQTGHEELVAEYAVSAVWHPDGKRIFFTRHARQVIELNPADGVETIRLAGGTGFLPEGVVPAGVSVREGDPWLALTLRGKIRATAVVDLAGRWTRIGDGCEILWHPDGEGLVYVDGPGKQKTAFYQLADWNAERRLLLDSPEPFTHDYFPKFSADGRFLVYGASTGGHEQDVADYEIFLWRLGDPPEEVVRLTAHTGNDNWPDIFIP